MKNITNNVCTIVTFWEVNILLSNNDKPVWRDDTAGVQYENKRFHVANE